jgi:hypothetical protein
MVVEETETQAAARVASVRARVALGQAAEVVEHIRASLTPADGRGERGIETLLQITPLHTERTDDADEIYVRLLEWVSFWSETLGSLPPSTAIVGWSRVDEDSPARSPERQVLGFPAGTTPGGAATLVRLLVMWLLSRDERLEQHSSSGAFFEDVTQMVWGFRAKYKLSPERVRGEPLARACPTCGELAVRAEFFGGSFRAAELRGDELAAEGVEVRCGHCGQSVAVSVNQVVRWLS